MIPKQLSHIWIGPLEPPKTWMNTWQRQNPDWQYKVYDNDYLSSKKFKLQGLIDEYLKRGDYAGVSDLMRYEILFENGGFIAPADAICLQNIDSLFTDCKAYTVYENEFVRGKLVSPILASEPNNQFIGQLIDELAVINPKKLLEPWKSTGNLFVALMIEKYRPIIEIFPSHYFNPQHYVGLIYAGNHTVYAKEIFGSTNESYTEHKDFWYRRSKRKKFKYRKKALKYAYQHAQLYKTYD